MPPLKKCERCDEVVAGKRYRCNICQRLCCSSCLDWPAGNNGVKWCSSYGSRTDEDCREAANAHEALESNPGRAS